MPSVFLVGFMGAGKSTTARCLAEILGCPCVDLDAVVEERVGLMIGEIFAAKGEESFRLLESEALQSAAGLRSAVVALGGGAFCSEGNRRLIRSGGGVSVFLDLQWSAIETRLSGDSSERPKFGTVPEARALHERRLEDYRRADLVIALEGGETPNEIAARIASLLEDVTCAS